MRDVFIIAGPGGMAYGKEEVNLLNSHISSNNNASEVSIIGNGEEKLELEKISEQLSYVAQTTKPVTIIIQMHGTVKDGQFYFLNGDERISSKDLFSMISQKIEFYQKNMDKDYNFLINPEIDLAEQNISPEANAIIVNLFRDYFATEEQKIKIKEILDLNQKKEEKEKREKYNPDDIFKNANKAQTTVVEMSEDSTNTALVEYKESFFAKFKNFIFKILHIKN